MRRRSGAGGEPIKTRRRKAAPLKRGSLPKDARRRGSAAGLNKNVALLTRERDEALEQLRHALTIDGNNAVARWKLAMSQCRTYYDKEADIEKSRHAFSQYEEFHGFAERHLPIVENDVFLAPWLVELRFDRVERNFLGKLLKSLFVELDPIHIVANQEFVQFLR